MAEEKKEEQAVNAEEQKSAPEAPAAAAPAQPAPSQAAPVKEEKKEAPKKEKPSTCAGCTKNIKKKRWYYRDGKYYCTKRCWTTAKKKAEKPEEAKAAS